MNIESTSYIDKQQNIWFKANEIATLLGYAVCDQAIRHNIDPEDIKQFAVQYTGNPKGGLPGYFINVSGFYSLVSSSKKELVTKFKRWVTSIVRHQLENVDTINYMIIPIIL